MLLEALFSAAAEAVFSYILDKLEPAERRRDWLKRDPVKLAYQHALARTYAAFAQQYPELTASLFSESLLTIEAALMNDATPIFVGLELGVQHALA